jgi:tetratricopeptide (TPR) repeat protein
MSATVPRDRYGYPLSTVPRAAAAYGAGLDTVLSLADGAEEHFAHAIALDPGFALGHAALALLGFEQQGVRTDFRARLAAAKAAVRSGRAISERERSFVHAVDARIADPDGACDADGPGSRAVLGHIREFPRDAFMVCIAVPTVAFGGLTSGKQTLDLVERLRPVYGSDWWYSGQLAFVRQAQGRWDEAEQLSVQALEQNPAAGHAVHARTHVFYETGRHTPGLGWLDGWIGEHGPRANSRAHFSWHAALHELALDDGAAVHRRYCTQLAPPLVTGPRALVDSGTLLWKCRMSAPHPGAAAAADAPESGPGSASGARPYDPDFWFDPDEALAVLHAAPDEWLRAPASPFATLHAAVALALAQDAPNLAALADHARLHTHPAIREVAAPLCEGLLAAVEQRWDAAATRLSAVVPRSAELQGSAAQMEIVEDTLLHALIEAGRTAQAAEHLSRRLDRRGSPHDRRRLGALQGRSAVSHSTATATASP